MEDDNEISQAMNKAMHASRLGRKKVCSSFYPGAIADRSAEKTI